MTRARPHRTYLLPTTVLPALDRGPEAAGSCGPRGIASAAREDVHAAQKFTTTAVATVREDTPVEEAAHLLVSHGYTVLPVVDEGSGLLGVVSETDLIDGRILPDRGH